MSMTRKALASLLVVGVTGSMAAFGVFSAFSDTTSNAGNTFSTGNVTISDNDAGGAMYNVTGAKPDVITSSCIRVTYTGSLASTVKLYIPPAAAPTAGASGAGSVDLAIYPVTFTTPPAFSTNTAGGAGVSCAGATKGSAVFTGKLGDFATARTSFTNGLALNDQAGGAVWNQNDAVYYEFDVSVAGATAPNTGVSSGTHSFQWEAQNN